MVRYLTVAMRKPSFGGKAGHIEWPDWVFPDGKRTNMRNVWEAVRLKRGVPKGFYAEAEKVGTPNLRFLAHVARKFGLGEAK